jgi:hypothetical protein
LIVTLLNAFNVGASFTAFTVTVNVRLTVLFAACPSFTVTVIVAVPDAFATGVNLTVPVVFGLVYVTVGCGTTPVLLELAVTVSVWFSLADPELIPDKSTVCWAASSFTLTLLNAFNVGG